MSSVLDIVLEHGVDSLQMLARCACVAKQYREVVETATPVWTQVVRRQMRNKDIRITRMTKGQVVKVFCLPKARAAQ